MMIPEALYRTKDLQKIVQPRVFITPKAFTDLQAIIHNESNETLMTASIEKIEQSHEYYITKIHIPPQTEVSKAHVETDDEEYGKWLMTFTREQRKKMKCHIHTHPSMGVTPSGLDTHTIYAVIEDLDDFYIQVICNEEHKFYVAVWDIKNNRIFKNIWLELAGNNLVSFNTKGPYVHNIFEQEQHKKLKEDLKSKIKNT